jgi:hypothetical protein
MPVAMYGKKQFKKEVEMFLTETFKPPLFKNFYIKDI